MPLKLVRMKRYDGARKLFHACPSCGYGVWLPEPHDPGYCPMCDGSMRSPKPDIDMSSTVMDTESLLSRFGL